MNGDGDPGRRVMVTGVGVVSAIGNDVGTFLRALHTNTIGIAPAPWNEDDLFAWWAVVRDFEPERWMDATVIAGSDLFTQFAVATAAQAVADAGLDGPEHLPMRRTAVVMGASMGGVRALTKAQHQLEQHGYAAVDRKAMIQMLPNMAAAQIAMRFGLHGPQLTLTNACAASIDAIGTAARLIRSGEVDVALVGGTEGGLPLANGDRDGPFAPVWFHAQANYGMMTGGRDPRRALTPFDVNRQGIATGDGAAMVVLESADHAAARGALIYGEVAGYASLADAFHPSSPEPSGRWEAEVMGDALKNAGVAATDVDALFAHGTGTPKGDIAEIKAINSVHGGRGLPVTAIKGHTGHTGAASGLMSALAALDTLRNGMLPNVAGTTDVEPEADFRVILDQPVAVDATTVQINAFGFGGQNSSLVLRRSG